MAKAFGYGTNPSNRDQAIPELESQQSEMDGPQEHVDLYEKLRRKQDTVRALRRGRRAPPSRPGVLTPQQLEDNQDKDFGSY